MKQIFFFLVALFLISTAVAQTPFDTLLQDKKLIFIMDSTYIMNNYILKEKDFVAGKNKPFILYETTKKSNTFQIDLSHTIELDFFSNALITNDNNGILYQFTLCTRRSDLHLASINVRADIPSKSVIGAYDGMGKFYQAKLNKPSLVNWNIIIDDGNNYDRKFTQYVTLFIFIRKNDLSKYKKIESFKVIIREDELRQKVYFLNKDGTRSRKFNDYW